MRRSTLGDGGGGAEVDTTRPHARVGQVDVRVDEGRQHESAVEVDDGVDPVAVPRGALLVADPRDPARHRRRRVRLLGARVGVVDGAAAVERGAHSVWARPRTSRVVRAISRSSSVGTTQTSARLSLAADPPLGWPAGVRARLQEPAEHLQAVDDGGARRGAVLADAAGEHEGVEAAEHGGVGPDVLAQPVHGDVERERRRGIPGVAPLDDRPEVRDPAGPSNPLSRFRARS